MNLNIKTVAELKEIASQLGQPGSPYKVEVHNNTDIEVRIEYMHYWAACLPTYKK